MDSIFILQHSYELGDCEETKFIGAYSTKVKAEDAIKRLSMQNGFKYRIEGFSIDKYEVNKDHWVTGFTTITSIKTKSKNGEWMTVRAECLPNNEFKIIEKYKNDKLGEFKDGDIVKCKEVDDELYATGKVNANA